VSNNSATVPDTAASSTGGESDLASPGIRYEQQGSAALVTLDRPQALNAINDEMRAEFPGYLKSWAVDPEIYAMIIRSGNDRAFSVGGDVRELYAQGKAGTASLSLANEYKLIWLLDRFTKPTISLIDGMVMGSGVGISQFGTHRVAGENYSFAMPEVSIGFFPDVGASWFLGRLKDWVGIYLGLTGARIGRADALAFGLVSHTINADRFGEITDLVADADPIDPVLDGMHEDPGEGELVNRLEIIRHCFSATRVEEIVSRLEGLDVGGADDDWRDETLKLMGRASPISLKVTLQQLRGGAGLDLHRALQLEYHLSGQFMNGTDFFEGVRANLIDKDFTPDWQCKELSDVGDDLVESYFARAQGSDHQDDALELSAPSDADVSNA